MQFINQSFKIITPSTKEEAIKELRNIEYACRMCYATCEKMTETSYERFIKARIAQNHTAPLEFGSMMVEITTSRDVLAELTRHRMASFCVTSQRYINYEKKDSLCFILPTWYKDNPELGQKWMKDMERAGNLYCEMIKNGAQPQEARTVLPNSTACTLVMKANLREWMHIFNVRCSPAAYPQIRELMEGIQEQARKLMPCVFE